MNQIVQKAFDFTKHHMSDYDASHDFKHATRVYNNAVWLAKGLPVNLLAIKLAAIMHDVSDIKYAKKNQDKNIIYNKVIEFGGSEDLANLVKLIVEHISFNHEIANMHLQSYKDAMLIQECQIVQDADRLDALGSYGIARVFIYNGMNEKTIDYIIDIITTKILPRKDMMKTELGKLEAIKRVKIMDLFLLEFTRENF